MIDPRSLARILGGDVLGRDNMGRDRILAPGPGHRQGDRSLLVTVDPTARDGFLVYPYSPRDTQFQCRDYVLSRVGGPLPQEHATKYSRQSWRPVVRRDEDERRRYALSLWDVGTDPRGTVVERYLQLRGLSLPDDLRGSVLRYHAALRISPAIAAKHPELGLSGRTFPGLLALFRDIYSDVPSAVLRTFLTGDGSFIDRAMVGPVRGCAIKLDPDENVTYGLHIGEGLETCLAARMEGFRPIWAVGNAGAIGAFPVLSGIDCLSIIVDNDHNETGQQASRDCSERWTSAGREVRRIIPNISGQDFNDIINGRKGKHAG